MDNLTEIINTRIDPKMRQQLTHQAEWRNLKLAQLIRLALAEWLQLQRGAGIPITQRRRNGSGNDGKE